MKNYRVMVTSYGYATIKANSEAEALKAVDNMDESCFNWDNDYSSYDASIVEEWEEE